MSQANRKKPETDSSGIALAEHHHEIFGIIFLLAAVIIVLSLVSFSPTDPVFDGAGKKATNLIGLVGAHLAAGLLRVLGISAFVLVAALLYATAVAFTKGGVRLTLRKVVGYTLLVVLGTAFCHIVFRGDEIMGRPPGGIVGEYGGGVLLSLLSTTGAVTVVLAGLVVGLIEVSGLSLVQTATWVGRGLWWLSKWSARVLARAGVILVGWAASASRKTFEWLKRESGEFLDSLRHRSRTESCETAADIAARPTDENNAEPAAGESAGAEPEQGFLAPPVSLPPPIALSELKGLFSEPPAPAAPAEVIAPEHLPRRSLKATLRDNEPEIVIPRHPNKAEKEEIKGREEPQSLPTPDYKNYELPDLSLLRIEQQPEAVIEKDKLHEYARKLETKLADYGIQGRVTKIMPGPVVTMYEYAPGPGIKVSRIAGLSNDLALALEAMSVRIVAPIPGRAVVGIEVANKERQTVYAREILGHTSFQRSRSKLTLALGKDIEGAPYVTDLNKMPHLLVAGATGTGKSVALNLMITSILYRNTPEEVRFLMVDPKVLELSLYDGIPHLLLPVVTDPRKANAALLWAVNEMERRILILHGAGVRDLDTYNRKVSEKPSDRPPSANKRKVIVIDKTKPGGNELPAPADQPQSEAPEVADRRLPHIVIVIDELADLMMTSSREVETSIARIAQKARAAGIHLIVATQRPSVNVITGLIKANLPARISFRVASKIDSRTILDQNGADSLLGNGDMLFHPPTTSELLRIHGALITEDEITRIVEHLKRQAKPVYDESILAAAESTEDPDLPEDEDNDELYDLAVAVVAEMGQASTSMVQRKLRIGYNRAARLIERMQREGIVGPADGAKPREVLISNHPP